MDLSKIDFTKCKLEPLGDLPVDVTSTKIAVSICSAETGVTMLRKERDSVWHTNQGALYMGRDRVNELFRRGDTVDAFIAAEIARIEAEDSWVRIHWRDANWLASLNASVQFLDEEICEWVKFPHQFNAMGRSTCSYRAKRRTFPTGYDPEKPRWVSISAIDDLDRLRAAGVTVRVNENTLGFTCDADIHTLPPGVPLHEEPKPEPRPCTKGFAVSHKNASEMRWLLGDGSWSRWSPIEEINMGIEFRTTAKEEPKPEWRPCSKWFALSHPNESEFRCRWQWVEGSEWSNYCPMSKFHNEKQMDYEFRTTAKEETEKRFTPGEFIKFLIDNPGEHTARRVGCDDVYRYRFAETHIEVLDFATWRTISGVFTDVLMVTE